MPPYNSGYQTIKGATCEVFIDTELLTETFGKPL